MRRFLIAAAFALLAVPAAAQDTTHPLYDNFTNTYPPAVTVAPFMATPVDGGPGLRAMAQFDRIVAAGRTIRLKGFCTGECTFALFQRYRGKICATAETQFGFHLPMVNRDTRMNEPVSVRQAKAWKYILANYPAPLRSWLQGRKIPDPHNFPKPVRPIVVKAVDIKGLIPQCPTA